MDSLTLQEEGETSDVSSPTTARNNLEDQNPNLNITESSNLARLKYFTGSSNRRISRGTNLMYVGLPATFSVPTTCSFHQQLSVPSLPSLAQYPRTPALVSYQL